LITQQLETKSHSSGNFQHSFFEKHPKFILFKHILKGSLAVVVHKLPDDLQKAIVADRLANTPWETFTPLARNEWICWVTSPKKAETRIRRIKVGIDKMRKGMRRPCCWAGCPHR